MTKVTVTYHDRDSFTADEIVASAKRNYGPNTHVELTPESTKPKDFLYFAIQGLITHEQLSLFFSDKNTYNTELLKLRKEILETVREVMDTVIIDNEAKLAKD
jgi:hypothetical protein